MWLDSVFACVHGKILDESMAYKNNINPNNSNNNYE